MGEVNGCGQAGPRPLVHPADRLRPDATAALATDVTNAGHYAFIAPCSALFAAAAPALCTSEPGFDRAAFHTRFNAAVVAFFEKTMAVK